MDFLTRSCAKSLVRFSWPKVCTVNVLASLILSINGCQFLSPSFVQFLTKKTIAVTTSSLMGTYYRGTLEKSLSTPVIAYLHYRIENPFTQFSSTKCTTSDCKEGDYFHSLSVVKSSLFFLQS